MAVALVRFKPEGKPVTLAAGALSSVRARPASLVLSVMFAALGAYFLYTTVVNEAYARYFWIGQTLAGLQWLLAAALWYLPNPPFKTTGDRWLIAISLAVIGLGLALRVWALFVWEVDLDEGFRLGATANMLRGEGITPIMSHFPEGTHTLPWFGYSYVLYGWWARLFGLGVLQARTLSYLLGLPALPFVYGMVRLWYGRRAAWITTAIFSVSVVFTQSTIARNDAFPTAAAAAMLFVHVLARQSQRPALHALSGALGVFALDGHVLNLIFLGAVGGTLLTDYALQVRKDGRWLRRAPLWFYLGGVVPAFLIYLYFHVLILPYPLGVFKAIGTGIPRRGVAGLIGWRLTVSLARVWTYWWHSPVENLLIVVATIAALARRTDSDNHWLTLFLFTQIGFFGAEINGSIHHTTYGLPIFLGATGALVTHGFSKQARPGSAWEQVALVGVFLAMIATTAGAVQHHGNVRRTMEDERAEALNYVRMNLSADEAIISSPDFYPYLTEYQTFLYPYYPVASKGPALARQNTDAYWQNIILDTWPAVRLVPPDYPFAPVESYTTYVAARHAQPVTPELWVPTNGELVTDAEYTRANGDAALQMVAHAHLPPTVSPGETLVLDSLWVTRGEIAGDAVAMLELVSEEGTAASQSQAELISGWAGTPTSAWGVYQFHDTHLSIPVPGDLIEGRYQLSLSLKGVDGACAPGCAFVVDQVAVVR
jgi:hypothetical protein